MGIFSKLADVETYKKSKFFQDGIYIVEIKDVKNFQNRHKHEMMCIETEVVKTKSRHADAPQPGETAAHIWDLDKDMGLPTWKGFLYALLGEEAVDEASSSELEDITNAIIADGLADTKKMFLEIHTTETKAGNAFTVHTWRWEAEDSDYVKFE